MHYVCCFKNLLVFYLMCKFLIFSFPLSKVPEMLFECLVNKFLQKQENCAVRNSAEDKHRVKYRGDGNIFRWTRTLQEFKIFG